MLFLRGCHLHKRRLCLRGLRIWDCVPLFRVEWYIHSIFLHKHTHTHWWYLHTCQFWVRNQMLDDNFKNRSQFSSSVRIFLLIFFFVSSSRCGNNRFTHRQFIISILNMSAYLSVSIYIFYIISLLFVFIYLYWCVFVFSATAFSHFMHNEWMAVNQILFVWCFFFVLRKKPHRWSSIYFIFISYVSYEISILFVYNENKTIGTVCSLVE